MGIYEVTLTAQVTERITVRARDEDDACELAEKIIRSETLDCKDLDWEWVDAVFGSEHDLEIIGE